jgi:hypothetical protein
MQTISCELAKRLDKLGVKRNSSFLHGIDGDILSKRTMCSINKYFSATPDNLYPAYTLDEVLEMLPESIEDEFALEVDKNSKIYYFYYLNPLDKTAIYFDTNPAEAAGYLLVWCIESGHVKAEDLK